MSDREMLEFAAKAAGVDVVRSRLDDPLSRDFLVNASARNPYQVSGPWNPITDDGDALRLMVGLGLKLNVCVTSGSAQVGGIGTFVEVEFDGDPLAATRRAIVRAAAEIGRQMP